MYLGGTGPLLHLNHVHKRSGEMMCKTAFSDLEPHVSCPPLQDLAALTAIANDAITHGKVSTPQH